MNWQGLLVRLMEGDQIAVIPYMQCYKCCTCQKGLYNCCKYLKVMGGHFDEGMTEQISVPIDHLIKTNQLTLDQIAII